MKRLIFSMLVVIALASAFASAAPVKHKKLERKKWTLTESPNFSILSDAKPSKIRKMIEHLERFRAFSCTMIHSGCEETTEPAMIIGANSRQTWRALGLPEGYVSLTNTMRLGKSTIFAEVKGFSGNSYRRSSVARATVFSSLAFKLFNDMGLTETTPFWYQEGFGQYLSGFIELDSRYEIGDLGAMGPRLQALFNPYGKLKPIDIVSLMSRNSYENSLTGDFISDSAHALFLAQSYLLVHYLHYDEKRRGQLSEFLKLNTGDRTLEERIVEAFGVSSTQLELNLRGFVDARVSTLKFDRDEVDPLMRLPELAAYSQRELAVPEFWQFIYPRIADLPDQFFTYSDKKALRDAVHQHLPKTKSIFDVE